MSLETPQSHQCRLLRRQAKGLQVPVPVWVNLQLPNQLSTGREALDPMFMRECQWQIDRDISR